MATPNNTGINTKSTVDDLKQAIGQLSGTQDEVTQGIAEIIKLYEGWADTQQTLVENLHEYIDSLGLTKDQLKSITDDQLKDIISSAETIGDTFDDLNDTLDNSADRVISLSEQISALINDIQKPGDFTRSWNRYLGQTGNLVNRIEVSLKEGEALSSTQLHTQRRKAETLKLQHDLLLQQYGISADMSAARQEAKIAELESKERRLNTQIENLKASNDRGDREKLRAKQKDLVDIQNQLSAINQLKIADKVVKLTIHQERLEKAARRKGTLGLGLTEGFGKLAGLAGFSNISETLKDSATRAKANIRIQQQANLAKAYEYDGVKQNPRTGKYTRINRDEQGNAVKVADKNGVLRTQREVIGDKELKAYIEGATRAVKTSEALKGIWTDVGKSIFSAGTALVIFTKLWNSFNEVDKAAVDVQHSIGSWEGAIAGANMRWASSVDVLKSIQSIVTEYNTNPIHIFSPEELGQMAEAKNLLGLTDQQATKLAVTSKLAKSGPEAFKNEIKASVTASNALAIQNGKVVGSVVAGGVALREALNASDAISVSMGMNATNIGAAAQAATALGLTLKDVEGISQNLINFESSIESEMSAQLLTGRQMNLSRARELALVNDLEGVAKELERQGMTTAEYGRMNVIQQTSFAKALGMTRDQYAHMIVQQALSKQMTVEQAKAALGDNVYEAMAATDKWNKSVEKLKQSFAPILNIISYIVDGIAWIAKSTAGLIGVGIVGVISFLPKIVAFVKSIATSWGTVTAAASALIRPLKAQTRELEKQKLLQQSAGAGVGTLNPISNAATTRARDARGRFVSTKGLTQQANAAGQDMSKFPSASKLLGLAAAIAALGAAAIGFGFAIKLIADSGASLGQILGFFGGFSVSIVAMAVAMKLAGSIMADPVTLLGIAALGAAAVGLGFALRLATPAIEAFGNVIQKTLTAAKPIIQSFIDGIKDLAQIIANAFLAAGPIIEAFGNVFAKALSGVKDIVLAVGTVLSSTIVSIGDAVSTAATGISNIIGSLGTAIQSVFTGIGTVVLNIGQSIAAAVMGIGSAIESLGAGIQKVFTGVADIVGSLGTAISGVMNSIANVVTSVATGISGILSTAFTGLTTLLSELTPDKALGLVALGGGLATASLGIAAFGAALLLLPLKRVSRFTEAIKGLGDSLGTLGNIKVADIHIPNIQFDKSNTGSIKSLAKALNRLNRANFDRIAGLANSIQILGSSIATLDTAKLADLKMPKLDLSSIKPLIRLANKANSLTLVANSIATLATSVERLGASLAGLDTTKLTEIKAPSLKTMGAVALTGVVSRIANRAAERKQEQQHTAVEAEKPQQEQHTIAPAVRKVEAAYTNNIQQQNHNRTEAVTNNTTVLETKVLERILTNIDKRLASGVDLRMNTDRLGRILALDQVGIG